MTPIEISANKQDFLSCCHQYIQREGLDNLLNYLEQKTDFFTAPSSMSFHLNEDGGLCRHSLNVFDVALKLNMQIVEPAIKKGMSPFSEPVSVESLAIASLFHDVCTQAKHPR